MTASSEPFVISVSSILDYQRCPRRWCYRWVENRVPRVTPAALTVGKTVHEAFEEHIENPDRNMGEILFDLLPPEGTLLDEQGMKAMEVLGGLVEPFGLWKDRFPIEETFEVEEPFSFTLSDGTIFRGRPDRVVRAFGKTFHMQTKTVAGGRDLGIYLTLAQRSLHELIYGWYLEGKYGTDLYGGSIFNIVRKLKYRSKQKTKAEPEGKILHTVDEIFSQHVVGIDRTQQEMALEDIRLLASMMKATKQAYHVDPTLVVPSRLADAEPYGHRLDPYTYVLLGEATLDDDHLFVDREELYEDSEEDSEA